MTSTLRSTFDLPATARPTVGDLKMSIVNVDHIGWLRCDGRALSTDEYRILFAVLGYRFGGSGNTFYLPDPQGRVLGCAGTSTDTTWSIGDVSGEETHVLTTEELPPHNHDAAGTAPPDGPGYTTSEATGVTTQAAGTHAHTGVTDASGSHLHTGTTDAAGAHTHTYTDAYFAENAGLGTGIIYGTNAATDSDNDFRYRTAANESSLTPSPLDTSTVSNHTHTFTTATTPNHVHTFLSDTSGAHTHAITDPTHRHQVASVGESTPFSLMQPTLFVGNLFIYSGRPFHRITGSDGITPPGHVPERVPPGSRLPGFLTLNRNPRMSSAVECPCTAQPQLLPPHLARRIAGIRHPLKVDGYQPPPPSRNDDQTKTKMSASNQNFLCPITQEVMMDPVIGSDGITYERAAIEAWFAAGHSTSPLTRAPMTSRSLVSNIALRAMIEEAGRPAAADADPIPATSVATNPPPILTAHRLGSTAKILATITAPAAAEPLPTLLINVLDISGSMGSPAADATHATDAAAFSRADLVRHSVATEIELLRPQDSLALVLFDNNAEVVLPPTQMTNHGRLAAKACLPQIAPRGGTNIWVGLQKALLLAAEAAATNPNTNIAIILQTDGESDPTYNPPRGIPDTFRTWLDTHPAAARVTVHTVGYGFGRALDTPLLRRLAQTGRGTVNYIPDGGMVGTVFIHLMANLMAVSHRDLTLQIPDQGLTVPIGFLQAGQTRRILLNSPVAEVYLTDPSGVLAQVTPTANAADPDTETRTFLIQALEDALTAAEGTPPLLATFMGAAAALRTDYGLPDDHPLLTDLLHADPAKGQIAKAFATADNFTRWGRHYIPCVISSYRNEWAINFKDATSTHLFGTPATRALIDRGDSIFTAIPPPTPSAATHYGYGGPHTAAPVSMASVHSSAGPCFLPASRVKMADGTEKRCDEIQPGDIDAAGYRIRCVVKTLVSHADVVRLENRALRPADAPPLAESGGFTLWHPVHHNGAWQHPATVGTVERVATDAIYNFILEWDDRHSLYDTDIATRDERPGVLIINGVMTCTLGHSMTGPVIGHPYFGLRETGKRNILDDLAADPGWATGYITWSNVQVTTDATTGWISGMAPRSAPA